MNQKIDARLAPRASLDHLKNQAKSLLKRIHENSPHAFGRLRRARVLTVNASFDATKLKLADAQLAIARENGCATWAELRAAVAQPLAAPVAAGDGIAILGLNQIWLDCTDLAATERFYTQILGLSKTGEVSGSMLFFDGHGFTLLLALRATVRPNSVLYFRLQDTEQAIQAAYNRLKLAGATVGDSPHCIAQNWQGRDVWLAFFSDPSGNQLAFKVDVPTRPHASK